MERLVQQQYDRWAEIYNRRWRTYVTNTLVFLRDWTAILRNRCWLSPVVRESLNGFSQNDIQNKR
jgi:hypothetical protein